MVSSAPQRGSPQSRLVRGLAPPEFIEALSLLGLSACTRRRFRGAFCRPEQQLAAFLARLGLPPLPAHAALMAAATSGPGGGGGGGGGPGAAAAAQRPASAGARGGAWGLGDAKRDPYELWWGMKLDGPTAVAAPAGGGSAGGGAAAASSAPGGGGDYRSSAQYNLVLIQVGLIGTGWLFLMGMDGLV